MKPPDDYILEILAETGVTMPPKALFIELDYTYDYVAKRCRILHEHGLLENPDPSELEEGMTPTGVYRISDKGRLYLSGDLDKNDLE